MNFFNIKTKLEALPSPVFSKENLILKKDVIALQKDWVNIRSTILGGLLQAGSLSFFIATVYLTLRNLKVAQDNLKVARDKQIADEKVANKNIEIFLREI